MWTCKERVLILICFLCGMIYFGYNTTNEMEQRKELGIELSAADITPTSMTLVCKQSQENWNGSLEIEPFIEIKRKSKIGWIKAPRLQRNVDVLYVDGEVSVPVGQTIKISQSWNDLYKPLVPGEYRLEKSIIYREDTLSGPFEQLIYYVQFTVE